MELRSWRRKPGNPQLWEGLAYNDTRGMFKDNEYTSICPDKDVAWQDFGTWFRVRVTDAFGVVHFRLDKHEEDTS